MYFHLSLSLPLSIQLMSILYYKYVDCLQLGQFHTATDPQNSTLIAIEADDWERAAGTIHWEYYLHHIIHIH